MKGGAHYQLPRLRRASLMREIVAVMGEIRAVEFESEE